MIIVGIDIAQRTSMTFSLKIQKVRSSAMSLQSLTVRMALRLCFKQLFTVRKQRKIKSRDCSNRTLQLQSAQILT